MSAQSEQTQPPKPASLAAWKGKKQHVVTLPSSAVVEIEVPDLPNMVASGQIPNSLVDVAVGVASGNKRVTREDIQQQAEFFNKLAAITVTKPEVSEEDFAKGLLPFEDKEMIVEFATRQRDMDAVGHHLGGLETVSTFRALRGLSSGLADLEDL